MAIADALFKIDNKALNHGNCMSLRAVLPQSIEVKQLNQYDGPVEMLDTAERFWYALQEV